MAADLLLELGSEELPAGFIEGAQRELWTLVVKGLAGARLHFDSSIQTFSTPRRLAIRVSQVAEAQPDLDRQVLGPPVKAAFKADGEPTQAALGFAKVNGLEVGALTRVATPKGEYLAAQVHEVGKPASALLPELLTAAIRGLVFPKTMRWGHETDTYARPLLWILALHGEAAVPLSYAGIHSGHTSRGHRFLHPDPFPLRKPAEYEQALRERKVEVSPAERRGRISKQLRQAAEASGAAVNAESERALLSEVTNLVEWPWAVVGSFEPEFLDLPREVLLSELTVHQRYFGLDQDGKLSNRFAVIAGTGVSDPAVSRHGYERVLRARLSDARFFWREDRKVKLESRVPGLGQIVFQQKLGTTLEKVERVQALAERLGIALELTEAQRASVARAVQLSKADLVTGMVGEFPELQGLMGGYYAAHDGEPPEVVAAVREQYLPKFAGDRLPASIEGQVVGLADRLDTLAGLFAIGKSPTGSADPFALRRACLAVVLVILGRGLKLSLGAALDAALAGVAAKASEALPATRGKLLEFFRARLKALWAAEFAPDVIEAVLVIGFDDLLTTRMRLEALNQAVQREEFRQLAGAFKRTASILEKAGDQSGVLVDRQLLVEAPEVALWNGHHGLLKVVIERCAASDFGAALSEMAKLKPAIDLFFEKVLVMADDPAVRRNRFALLREVRSLFCLVADLSQIQG